jgi:hypothetical protein
MLCGFRDLRVYNLALKVAMEIFELSRSFPAEELRRMIRKMMESPERFLPS